MNRGAMFFIGNTRFNLVLGNAGSVINSPFQYQNYFGIPEANVKDFFIDSNNNSFCRIIGGNINLSPPSGSGGDPLRAVLRYIVDLDNIVTGIPLVSSYSNAPLLKSVVLNGLLTVAGGSAFRNSDSIATLFLPNITSFNNTIVMRDSTGLRYAYFPSLTFMGGGFCQGQQASVIRMYLPVITLIGSSNATAQGTFQVDAGSKIYVNPFMMTANAGGLEADLQQAIDTYGAEVISIDNTTPPNMVTDLSASNITSTSVDLNFTTPSSLNLIDFYEVWVENIDLDKWHFSRVQGKYDIFDEITISGDTVNGLSASTNYRIWVVTCDEYWNRSEPSNIIQITTL